MTTRAPDPAPAPEATATPDTVTGKQRRHLRGLAHGLDPVVHVGQAGISDGILAALDRVLLDHELVKVRLHEPADKRGMADELARRSAATLCGLVGHTVILYRPHPENPRISLP